MSKVCCNKCATYVPVDSLVTVKTWAPDGNSEIATHYHDGHDIAEDYDNSTANSWDTICGDTLHGKMADGGDIEHTCYKPTGHADKHECFMAPNACTVKGW
jgi:hypothetical protein